MFNRLNNFFIFVFTLKKGQVKQSSAPKLKCLYRFACFKKEQAFVL